MTRGRHLFFVVLLTAAVCVTARSVAAQDSTDNGAQGRLIGAGQCTVLPIAGFGTASIEVAGSHGGTVSFAVSNSNTTYTPLNVRPPNSSTEVTSTASTGAWSGPVAGWTFLRACLDGMATGEARVYLSAAATGGGGGSAGTFEGEVNVGAQPATDPHFVRCSDGSTAAACVVSGTVTANLSATDNAVLDDIADGIPVTNAGTFATQAAQSGTWNITNVSGTVSLPTGAATAANQSTGNTSLSTIAGDTTDIETAIEGLDHAEDAPHTSGQTGLMVFGVRQDSQVDFGADGDYTPFSINDAGELRVSFSGAAGGTSLADDGDFAPGTTSATPVSGLYQSTVTACTDGDACAIGITAQRAAKFTAYDESGTAVPVAAAGSGTISGTTQRITIATDDPVNDALVALDGVIVPAGESPATDGVGVQGVTGGLPIAVEADILSLNGSTLDESNPLPVCVTDPDTSMCLSPAQGATHGDAVAADGPQVVLEAKDVDGSALPNAVLEGEAVRAAGTLSGVALAMLVNEDGSAERGTTASPFQVQSNSANLATETTLGSVLTSTNFAAAFGTAGSADAQVMSVQGVASMTPLQVQSNSASLATQTTLASIESLLGACTPNSVLSAASVNETEIKATAGRLKTMVVMSLDATPVYIKLYNDTAANTDETDTPVQRYMVPANATAANGAGFVIPIPPGGINFTTAITFRATTGIADNDTGALTANEVLINYCFQ